MIESEQLMDMHDLKLVLDERNIRLSLEGEQLKFSAPKGAMSEEIKQAIRFHKPRLLIELKQESLPELPGIARHIGETYQPFPMTPIQQAYYVGECGGLKQSTLPCFYHEYRLHDVDLGRLEAAIRALIKDFPVLRLKFFEDNRQQVVPWNDDWRLDIRDFRKHSVDECNALCTEIKHQHLNELPPLDSGQPFRFTVIRRPDSDRLLVTIRLNIIDGPSLAMLLRGLVARYGDIHVGQPEGALEYRDYVLATQKLKNTPNATVSEEYWERMLPLLPSSPALPQTGKSRQQAVFQRHSRHWEMEKWLVFRQTASKHGVTANAALLAVYATALSRWSSEPSFTLNVLANFRPFTDPELKTMAGNCSNTVPVDSHSTSTFIEQVKWLQDCLTERLEHAIVPGVELMRRIQQASASEDPVLPYVFTSGLQSGQLAEVLPDMHRFELFDSHLQTPQVWLDHQVIENHEGLICYWDCVEEIFEPGIIEALVEESSRMIDALIASETAWLEQYPGDSANQSLKPWITGPEVASDKLLCSDFIAQAKLTPTRTAIQFGSQSISYGELLSKALSVAAGLAGRGVTEHDIIAVQLPKSIEQVIALYGILLSNAAYLPLSVHWPEARIDHIVQASGAKLLVSQSEQLSEQCVSIQTLFDAKAQSPVLINNGERLAYVIYTSGSTGEPKGVMITHNAALNTIEDINRRFTMNENDRVLGVSGIYFDLSVQDIFGTLSVGATLVLPGETERPEPSELIELCRTQRITVWNSVPAILHMLTMISEPELPALSSLRLIMLSGDWIPLPLAKQLKRACAQAELVSLGGATEASIWSNWFQVENISPEWRSIPYGYGLSNQQLYVLDREGKECLTGAIGEIHIAGDGLALGYLNDPQRTAAQFIEHFSGQRLYRTGDLGRYFPDGAIEFLGRKDAQVKINGFRVELTEIETQLTQVDGIENATVVVHRNEFAGATLLAVYSGRLLDERLLSEKLVAQLPGYMVPVRFIWCESLPISQNGKIDREQALAIARKFIEQEALNQADAVHSEQHEVTNKLIVIWQSLFDAVSVNEQSHFFRLGGNSLQAVRLSSRIEKAFGCRLSLHQLFSSPHLYEQSELILARVSGDVANVE
ncbi:Long-chain-fatty-acid--CoA ligase [Photobacterium marinum]|uniref:Long-chain-fatty-acid--CoA ligase n=1 Tax=Photobacterium marinum TaxID=1056511 RepID=L8JH06_9GAMM|nr:non-ribosomal peptide synthetase [Photobacterium marinum]ELR66769.1 Long-chain-fatty-acid--CoA ligase [Photobacterium marinum]